MLRRYYYSHTTNFPLQPRVQRPKIYCYHHTHTHKTATPKFNQHDTLKTATQKTDARKPPLLPRRREHAIINHPPAPTPRRRDAPPLGARLSIPIVRFFFFSLLPYRPTRNPDILQARLTGLNSYARSLTEGGAIGLAKDDKGDVVLTCGLW